MFHNIIKDKYTTKIVLDNYYIKQNKELVINCTYNDGNIHIDFDENKDSVIPGLYEICDNNTLNKISGSDIYIYDATYIELDNNLMEKTSSITHSNSDLGSVPFKNLKYKNLDTLYNDALFCNCCCFIAITDSKKISTNKIKKVCNSNCPCKCSDIINNFKLTTDKIITSDMSKKYYCI